MWIEEPASKEPEMCEKEVVPMRDLTGLVVKTILQEEMMKVASEKVKFSKNLSARVLSVGDDDFLGSPVEIEGLVDRMREGWKVWKKKGGDKDRNFELKYIKYLPVRSDVIDIIELQVSENDGTLVNFASGVTTVTLHFKHE